MQAVTYHGPDEVRVEEVPGPTLQRPGDALVRVGLSAVCGSDLHIYHGEIPGVTPGSVLGHEFVGVVEEVGGGVRRFQEGDRVVGTFHVACGVCGPCRGGHFHQCEQGAVYGYGVAFGDLSGAQAERLRVPWADVNLRRLRDDVSDEQGVFASDTLTTAYGAVRKADLRSGETCAVIGCGPVGLLVVQCARLVGASRVIGIDVVKARTEMAARFGAVPVHSAEANPVARVQQLTDGRGVDVVVEAVGGGETLQLAFDLVRGGGRISAVGVTAQESFEFPLMSALVRDIEFRLGLANIHRDIDTVLRLLAVDRLDPLPLISHRLPLEEAPEGYRLFAEREAIKVLLEPGRS